MVAKAAGVSLRAVQRIWQANRLQPHRLRTPLRRPTTWLSRRKGRRCRRPLHEPARPCRRHLDRREIADPGALDRTQPGLPMKPGKCGTMTHDYKRNGTTTLFAAPQRPRRHRGRPLHAEPHTYKEFIKFLNAVERAPRRPARSSMPSPTTTPPTSILLSSSGSPDHPRWPFHFPPRPLQHPGSTPSKASSSSIITRRQIRRAASSRASPSSKPPSTAYINQTY